MSPRPVEPVSGPDPWIAFWRSVEERQELLLYKHSPRCSGATRALGRIEDLERARPDLAILMVDVIGQRALSQEISRRLGVVHESPQVILVRAGRAVWHASHSGVTVEAVTSRLEGGVTP